MSTEAEPNADLEAQDAPPNPVASTVATQTAASKTDSSTSSDLSPGPIRSLPRRPRVNTATFRIAEAWSAEFDGIENPRAARPTLEDQSTESEQSSKGSDGAEPASAGDPATASPWGQFAPASERGIDASESQANSDSPVPAESGSRSGPEPSTEENESASSSSDALSCGQNISDRESERQSTIEFEGEPETEPEKLRRGARGWWWAAAGGVVSCAFVGALVVGGPIGSSEEPAESPTAAQVGEESPRRNRARAENRRQSGKARKASTVSTNPGRGSNRSGSGKASSQRKRRTSAERSSERAAAKRKARSRFRSTVAAMKRDAQACGKRKGAFPGDRIRIEYRVRRGKVADVRIVGRVRSADLRRCITSALEGRGHPGPDESRRFSITM